MVTRATLASENAEQYKAIQDLATLWRDRAYRVQADMKGSMKGARYSRPGGAEKARMGVQVSVLLSCASALEQLL